MFDSLAQMVKNLQNPQEVFDPAQIGDPIATQTNWGPAKGGGSSFRNFKLVRVNPNRMEFKTTIGAILFALIFALPGTALLVLLILDTNWSAIDGGIIVGFLLGLVFASLGGYMLYKQMLPIVFDKQEGLFWKKRRPQAGMMTNEATDKYVRLGLVHALQIIVEYIRSKNGGYYSYELNLVLKNGDRVNVVDHGRRKKLAAEAEVLAEFLGVPVWDATLSRPQTNTSSVTLTP